MNSNTNPSKLRVAPSAEEVKQFYDGFSSQLVRDYVWGNRRVEYQLDFLRSAIPRSCRRVLVVGCGTGLAAHQVARRIAPHARVLGLDLSPANIDCARALFPHARLEFDCRDAVRDPIEGRWDAIVLPDVYEHISRADRLAFHEMLNRALSAEGRVLMSCPTPGLQQMLRKRGHGLQIVDEDVHLADLQGLASQLGAAITYFAMVSIWNTNDYFHAMLERNADQLRPVPNTEPLQLKRHPARWRLWLRTVLGRRGWLWMPWRRLHVLVALRGLKKHLTSDAASERLDSETPKV